MLLVHKRVKLSGTLHVVYKLEFCFILFLYNLFLCDIEVFTQCFFFVFLILLVILYGPQVCNKLLNKQTIKLTL